MFRWVTRRDKQVSVYSSLKRDIRKTIFCTAQISNSSYNGKLKSDNPGKKKKYNREGNLAYVLCNAGK